LASVLLAQGYDRGDRIAILAKNSAEWIMADLAIMMACMISVPIYATAGSETIDYVLQHSEAKALFVGSLDSVDAVSNITAELTKISFSNSAVAGDYQLQG
jgi:long-chain acyl-CoA synthetase